VRFFSAENRNLLLIKKQTAEELPKKTNFIIKMKRKKKERKLKACLVVKRHKHQKKKNKLAN